MHSVCVMREECTVAALQRQTISEHATFTASSWLAEFVVINVRCVCTHTYLYLLHLTFKKLMGKCSTIKWTYLSSKREDVLHWSFKLNNAPAITQFWHLKGPHAEMLITLISCIIIIKSYLKNMHWNFNSKIWQILISSHGFAVYGAVLMCLTFRNRASYI
jgi:hypothetical protein